MRLRYRDTILLIRMWHGLFWGECELELFWIALNYQWAKEHSEKEAWILLKRINDLKPFME